MIEPIVSDRSRAVMLSPESLQDSNEEVRDKALLYRATTLAIESAFKFGKDLPVGAIAAGKNWIVGRHFASDQRNEFRRMHAEYMAEADARMGRIRDPSIPATDTIVVTLEPCNNCQDFLASIPNLKRVGFSLSRQEVADTGLVKPHDESVFQRAARLSLPYEVLQIEDDQLSEVNRTILACTSRDRNTELVDIDQCRLYDELVAFNNS